MADTNAIAQTMEDIVKEVEGIDAQIELYAQMLRPLQEKRQQLVVAWNAISEMLTEAQSLEVEAPTAVPNRPVMARRRRSSMRSVMLEKLKENESKAVSSDELWSAVVAAGLTSKMKPNEAVYQTLYAAKKDGEPLEQFQDGSWIWNLYEEPGLTASSA